MCYGFFLQNTEGVTVLQMEAVNTAFISMKLSCSNFFTHLEILPRLRCFKNMFAPPPEHNELFLLVIE
jgi:hypothetical protein